MYATVLHHDPSCGQSDPPLRVVPQPKGVGIALYQCPACGAIASTKKSAAR